MVFGVVLKPPKTQPPQVRTMEHVRNALETLEYLEDENVIAFNLQHFAVCSVTWTAVIYTCLHLQYTNKSEVGRVNGGVDAWTTADLIHGVLAIFSFGLHSEFREVFHFISFSVPLLCHSLFFAWLSESCGGVAFSLGRANTKYCWHHSLITHLTHKSFPPPHTHPQAPVLSRAVQLQRLQFHAAYHIVFVAAFCIYGKRASLTSVSFLVYAVGQ